MKSMQTVVFVFLFVGIFLISNNNYIWVDSFLLHPQVNCSDDVYYAYSNSTFIYSYWGYDKYSAGLVNYTYLGNYTSTWEEDDIILGSLSFWQFNITYWTHQEFSLFYNCSSWGGPFIVSFSVLSSMELNLTVDVYNIRENIVGGAGYELLGEYPFNTNVTDEVRLPLKWIDDPHCIEIRFVFEYKVPHKLTRLKLGIDYAVLYPLQNETYVDDGEYSDIGGGNPFLSYLRI